MPAGEDRYVLERTQAEYQRLRAQARVWEEATGRVLGRAGLAAGMRCLDVGCGPGEVMRLMGRTVGQEGHVTGFDIDASLGEHVLAELRREEGPQFDFAVGDITRGDAVPGAPFDLVFARLLLCHMNDPVAAVRTLAAQLRPGGRPVLMDYDMTRLAARPEDAAFDRGQALLLDCLRRAGKQPDAGLRLPDYLREAGLSPPEGSHVAGLFLPIRTMGAMLRTVLASLIGTATELGIATAEEMADVQGRLQALEAENRQYALGPLMIGVWTTVSPA